MCDVSHFVPRFPNSSKNMLALKVNGPIEREAVSTNRKSRPEILHWRCVALFCEPPDGRFSLFRCGGWILGGCFHFRSAEGMFSQGINGPVDRDHFCISIVICDSLLSRFSEYRSDSSLALLYDFRSDLFRFWIRRLGKCRSEDCTRNGTYDCGLLCLIVEQ